MSATEVAGRRVDDADDKDALDRATDDAQGQSLGVVLIPGLDIEGQECYNDNKSAKMLSHVLGRIPSQRGTPGSCSS